MVKLILELIKFPFKLIGYVAGGCLWLLGAILVHGDNKDAEKVAVGVLLVLSAAVAVIYYGLNQRTTEHLLASIGIFLVLFLLIAVNVALFRWPGKKNNKK